MLGAGAERRLSPGLGMGLACPGRILERVCAADSSSTEYPRLSAAHNQWQAGGAAKPPIPSIPGVPGARQQAARVRIRERLWPIKIWALKGRKATPGGWYLDDLMQTT